MRRTGVIAVGIVCLASFVVWVLASASGAQPAPTPVGQLGGPMSLTPQQEQQVTPNPTPSEEATPGASSTGPEGCTVAPLPLETALGLLNGTAERRDDGSASTPTAEGSADTISTTFDIFVACVNGGDYLRIAAITTDEYFQEIVTGTGWDRADLESNLSSLHPREPDHYLQILGHGPVLNVSDTLATEVVVLLDPAAPYFGQIEVGVTYELVNGQWLVGGIDPIGS